MQILWSLFRRDVEAMPRRGRFYWNRVAFALACAILVVLAFSFAAKRDASIAGLEVFRNLCFLLVLWACLMAPHAASQALSAERQNRLIGLLMLTDMKLWHLLVGKLCFAMWRSLLGILAALPMIMLCVSLGGVSTTQIWMAAAVLAATIFSGTCLGLLAATISRREVRTNNLVIFGALLLYLILPMGLYVLHRAYGLEIDWAFRVSPALAMYKVVLGDSAGLQMAADTCLTLLALGVLFMVVTAILLPVLQISRREEDGDDTVFLDPLKRAAQHHQLRRVLRWADTRENAVLWREFSFVYGGFAKSWQQFGLVATIFLLLGVFGFLHAELTMNTYLEVSALSFTLLSLVLLLIFFTVNAARMFRREDNAGTVDILLCTSMPEATIVGAKVGAIYLMLLPWVVSLLAGLAWYVVSAPNWGSRGLYVLILGYSAATWYTYSGLVIYLSCRMVRHVELLSFGFLLLWLTVGTSMLATLGAYLFYIGGLFGPAIFILAPLALGYALRRMVTRNLRKYVLTKTSQ